MQRGDQPGTSGWITDLHQHRVTIVSWLASHVHLRDEPHEAATRDGEIDVRDSGRRFLTFNAVTRITTHPSRRRHRFFWFAIWTQALWTN